MTSNGTFSVSRTACCRHGVAQRAPIDSATLIAATLFVAVLIAEATFVLLNATSIAGLSALTAAAGGVT